MNNAIAPTPAGKPDDFASLVNLLEALTAAENNLTKLQQTLDSQHLETVRGHLPAYKELQTKVGEFEAAIEVIVTRNPQWFADKQNLATPVGAVKRTSSTKLEVADPTVTITLIKAHKRDADFIRTTEELRLEVLEGLDDEQLAKLGIKRVTTHNFKTAPKVVDLGKAVKAADKTDKAATKTAKKVA